MADPAGSIAAPGAADCLTTGAAGRSSPFNRARAVCKLCWNSGDGSGSAFAPYVIGTVPMKRRTVAARTDTARIHVLKRHSQLPIPNSSSRHPSGTNRTLEWSSEVSSGRAMMRPAPRKHNHCPLLARLRLPTPHRGSPSRDSTVTDYNCAVVRQQQYAKSQHRNILEASRIVKRKITK